MHGIAAERGSAEVDRLESASKVLHRPSYQLSTSLSLDGFMQAYIH